MNSSKSADLWDRIAGRYDRQVFKIYSKAYEKTVSLSAKYLKKDFSVLDFACGTGIVTLGLTGHAGRITAIDTSGKMIDIAAAKAAAENIANIEFSPDDIFDSKFDNKKFDAVTAFNILLYIEDIEMLLKRIRQLLKPGGVFVSSTDCLGEKRSILNVIRKFLGFLGIFPYMKFYSSEELEQTIKQAGFSLIKTAELFSKPLNYFIAAK